MLIDTTLPVEIDARTNNTKGLSQAYALRDVAYQLAVKYGCKPETLPEEEVERARSVTALIKAWSEADDRVRIHRGKPLPGSLRPESKRKQARTPRKSAPNGPISPATPQPAVLEPQHNSTALTDVTQPVLTTPSVEVVK